MNRGALRPKWANKAVPQTGKASTSASSSSMPVAAGVLVELTDEELAETTLKAIADYITAYGDIDQSTHLSVTRSAFEQEPSLTALHAIEPQLRVRGFLAGDHQVSISTKRRPTRAALQVAATAAPRAERIGRPGDAERGGLHHDHHRGGRRVRLEPARRGPPRAAGRAVVRAVRRSGPGPTAVFGVRTLVP